VTQEEDQDEEPMSQPPQPPIPPTDQPTDPNNPAADEAQPFIITLPDDPASHNDWYLWAAVLALIALVAFWPAISGTFLWDDDQYVTQNHALLDASGLKQIWKIPPGTIQYYPLTFTTLWIEHHFWENNSVGYRVVNLILHAGAALILWRILRRLSIPGAWAAAAIWAIHPLQAESVCWISECKNILSGILALASVLFYLEFAGFRDPDYDKPIWELPEEWHLYAISLGFFILALLSKTAVCLVPIAILLILWWKGRLNPIRILGLAPMLIIGAILAWETSRLETDPTGPIGATGPDWQLTFAQRLQIAGHDLWFYLGKLLLPIHQSFVYPREVPNSANFTEWLPLIAAILVIAILAIAIKHMGKGPLAAALCYIAILFPALGFANVYPFRFSFVADHYQYLAGIPLIVLIVWLISLLTESFWKPRKIDTTKPLVGKSAPIAILATALLLLLGIASWNRATIFADSLTLWQDVLKPDKNPQSWLAASNLARLEQGQAISSFDDAATYLQSKDEASSKASAADAQTELDDSNNMVKLVLGNPQTPPDVRYKAYDQAAENDITLMRSPDSDSTKLLADAATQMSSAIAFPEAQNDPLPFYLQGLVHMKTAVELQKSFQASQPAGPTISTTTRPASPEEQPYFDLYQKARESLSKSIQLSLSNLDSPRISPEALRVLPLAALQRGIADWSLADFAHSHADVNSENQYSRDAVTDFGYAVQFKPDNVENRYRLALALENIGQLDAAKANLMFILGNLNPHYAPAYNEMGRLILESKPTNMDEFEAAVESFREALKEDPSMRGAQKNLDLALKMLATTRPATQASTAPSSHPSP
jgi:tetratricopeptide (TPR) repeat protein